MTVKQQNLSSIHIAAGMRNTVIVPTSLLFYLIYIRYVHVNVNKRWHCTDNEYARETDMKILSDIQKLIWMGFLPLMELPI